MTQQPGPVPLRWWEKLIIFMLAQSPRIERIIVTQRIPDVPASGPDEWDSPEDDEDLDDETTHYANYLEHLYHAPSAEPEVD